MPRRSPAVPRGGVAVVQPPHRPPVADQRRGPGGFPLVVEAPRGAPAARIVDDLRSSRRPSERARSAAAGPARKPAPRTASASSAWPHKLVQQHAAGPRREDTMRPLGGGQRLGGRAALSTRAATCSERPAAPAGAPTRPAPRSQGAARSRHTASVRRDRAASRSAWSQIRRPRRLIGNHAARSGTRRRGSRCSKPTQLGGESRASGCNFERCIHVAPPGSGSAGPRPESQELRLRRGISTRSPPASRGVPSGADRLNSSSVIRVPDRPENGTGAVCQSGTRPRLVRPRSTHGRSAHRANPARPRRPDAPRRTPGNQPSGSDVVVDERDAARRSRSSFPSKPGRGGICRPPRRLRLESPWESSYML